MIDKILDFIQETEIDDIKFYNDDYIQSVIVTMSKGFKHIQQIYPYKMIINSTDSELKFYLKRCAKQLRQEDNINGKN